MTCKHIILFYILIANVYVFANIKPHIILIIGDDLGWNDVGFHGSNEIPTPNIDALAYNGLILNRHYVQPTCTPSRAALMTGKYPIRLGMQGPPLEPTSPTGLPLNERIWPEYFKKLGYVSRLVGKWHLGYYKYQFTPTKRGFDSHFGYYNGWIRYNDTVSTTTKNQWGFDARINLEHAGDRFKGKYATDVFTEEAVDIIKNHDVSKPLFLDVSQVAVHACAKNSLQVRNKEENDKKFSYIKDPERRLFAGVLTALDESVEKIIVALDEKNMLKNSIVLMMADNGGSTKDTGFGYGNTGSNWPLRGWKASVTEGGVRGAAAIWSPLIPKNAVSYELLHICDWLPTFYAAAGGNANELEDIDGVNQWEYLTNKQTTSSRHEVLLNINELKNDSALIFNEWKYIQINYASIDYAGSDGRNANLSYSINEIINTETHKILSKFTQNNENPEDLFIKLRTSATIDENCRERIEVVRNSDYTSKLRCFETGCLFHLKNDPCEFTDLSENESKLLEQLKEKMKFYREQLVPQITAKSDPNSNPALWDNYWSPWILDNDYSSSSIPICYKLILIFVVASVFFRFQVRF